MWCLSSPCGCSWALKSKTSSFQQGSLYSCKKVSPMPSSFTQVFCWSSRDHTTQVTAQCFKKQNSWFVQEYYKTDLRSIPGFTKLQINIRFVWQPFIFVLNTRCKKWLVLSTCILTYGLTIVSKRQQYKQVKLNPHVILTKHSLIKKKNMQEQFN